MTPTNHDAKQPGLRARYWVICVLLLSGVLGVRELAREDSEATQALNASSDVARSPAPTNEGRPEAEPASEPQEPTAAVRRDAITSRRLELRVALFGSNSLHGPRPGAAFQVGIARDQDAARSAIGEDKRVLFEGITDDNGRALVTLDLPERLLDAWGESARLWGAPVGVWPGGDTLRPIPREPSANFGILHAPGPLVSGHVVDADGEPVVAEIQFWHYFRLLERPRWVRERTVQSDEHGDFHVALRRPGEFRVYAHAAEHGTAFLDEVHVPESNEPRRLALRLSGSGVLAGRVTDPAGAPIPYLPLRARPEAQRGAPPRDVWDPTLQPDFAADGLRVVEAQTDLDGRFRIAALAPGGYDISAYVQASSDYDERLTTDAVPTGSEALALVSRTRRLHVRVLDHDGEPIEVSPFGAGLQQAIPQHALYVLECDERGRVLQAEDERSDEAPRWRLPNGDFSVEVRSGARYVVGVVSRECPLVERYVSISPGTARPLVELRLSAPSPGTSLRAELAGVLDAHHVLRSPTSDARLWTGTSSYFQRHGALAVGPGAYRLVSSEWKVSMCGTGAPVRHATSAPADDLVDLHAGREALLEQALRPTGALQLTLRCDDPPAPTPRPTDDAPDDLTHLLPDSTRHEDLRRWNGGARVTLHAGDDTLVPRFDLGPKNDWVGTTGSSGLAAPWAPLNHPLRTSSPIPPGTYRLTVEREGLPRVERDVVITDGETTEVVIELAR